MDRTDGYALLLYEEVVVKPDGGQPLLKRRVGHGLRRVFALTLVPDFFQRCGFVLTTLGRLPEKSASECPVCPKRFACDEHAMLLHLDGTVPEPLAASEPVGYTRLFLGVEPGGKSAQ